MSRTFLIATVAIALLLIAASFFSGMSTLVKLLLVLLIVVAALLLLSIKNMAFMIVLLQRAGERRKDMFEILTTRAVDTVMLGDSITFEGAWDEFLAPARIANRGIGGDTAGAVLNRLGAIYPLRPSRLFLLIGINDLNRGVALAQTKTHYTQILQQLRRELPTTTIYVQSILPVNKQWKMASNADVQALNDFIRPLAEQAGCKFIDLYSLFVDAQGELKAELSNDGIHLSHQGYTLWCEAIRPLLAAQSMN